MLRGTRRGHTLSCKTADCCAASWLGLVLMAVVGVREVWVAVGHGLMAVGV